ncbi:Rieske 2Fe-2S domain-containing protein [Candidatus Poriferisocius sp.]|uniref:Rieske 2Fe-2S domain-containing protein n=1 Tax=Candidatus Poriferisocius sp. TaxID=3101276 RepID=UPI003B02437C
MAAEAESRVDYLDAETESSLYESIRDKFWYPVAYSDELDDSPQAVTLFGERLVVVRLDGEPAVFDDQCLHKGTALSLGVVDDGCLRCPYHGWKYSPDGSIVRIPAREELSGLVKAKLRRYPTVETSGLVYTCLGDEPRYPPPSIPEFEDPAYEFLHLDIYEWDCSLARRLENYFDFSHFAWVHDGILGDSSQPRIDDYEVERVEGEIRFEAGPFPEFTDNVKNAPESSYGGEAVYGAMKRYRVFIPNAMRLNSAAGETEDYVLWVCLAPVGPERTRCFTYQGRNYGFDNHYEFMAFAQLVTDQDRPIVESQRPTEVPAVLPAEMFVKGADLALLEYRRWLLEIANE